MFKSSSEKSSKPFLGICSPKTLREARRGHWLCGLVVSVLHEGSRSPGILIWVRASDALGVLQVLLRLSRNDFGYLYVSLILLMNDDHHHKKNKG